MYKVIGFMLIIVACSGMGYSKSQEMNCHLKELETVKQIFYLLRSELQYTRAPFEEVFRKIGRKMDGKYGIWLEKLAERLNERGGTSFWNIWKESIEQELSDSYLKEKDLESLKKTGRNLGYMENIDLYIEQLEYEIKNTREDYRTKRKLCQSMGIMGGIFLVILLL